jgi:hypothetical protein
MVGNDVVDLEERMGRGDAIRPRFDRRVFGDDERRAIAESDDGDRMRWSLWAAKEAAYKAAKRMDDSVIWSPLRFRVELEPGGERGRVIHESGTYPVRFVPAEAGVHALAVAEPWASDLETAGEEGAHLQYGCRRGKVGDASAEVRRLALEGLADRLGATADDLEVRRRERIPELWCRGVATDAPLSLSHHGRLLAYACWIPAVKGAA